MDAREEARTGESAAGSGIPFDTQRLDALLDRAGIEVLVVSSKHNIQYLIGGAYRFFFFEHFDAIGLSRYLPLLVYVRGRPDEATYVGNPMENYERALGKFWMPDFIPAWGSEGAMTAVVERLSKLGREKATIGVERAFLPANAEEVLRRGLPSARIVDATVPLERLRAKKTPQELEWLRLASERVVDSMLAVIAAHGPGTTKLEMVEALRREEVARGLTFEYCLITAGQSLNRAPSEQVWREGDPMSIDSGGNYKGYIGDLCRMAVLGEPDAELEDLLAEIDEIQMAARKPIRAGARGGDIFAAANEVIRRSPNGNLLDFVAHGMGLISHEAPRLTGSGPVPYPGDDQDEPLQAGMVLSIETTLPHPRRGYIKLEDTVAVTETGWEAFGDGGRGWNRGGTAL
jgi:Xaa-Pro aminopeptidase